MESERLHGINLTLEGISMSNQTDFNLSGLSESTGELPVTTAENMSGAQFLLWEKILAWDLSRVKLFLINRESFDPELVEEMETEYKKFLFLRIVHPDERLPMSKDVDEMWHIHVLHTRNYAAFCEEIGEGRFIHHGPTISEDENWSLMPDYLNGTLVRYTEYFGHPSEKFWKTISEHGACCYC